MVVAGAGIFGACSAYFLQRQGYSVLLLDAWGVAHPRATSGGETRILRASYGTQSLYTRWSWEALGDWKEWQRDWRTELFIPTGVLWLSEGEEKENDYLTAGLRNLVALEIPAERWTVEEMTKRFPQIAPLETRWAMFEPQAGVLLARKGCRAVVDAFERAGGRFEIAAALRPAGAGKKLVSLETADAKKISAGIFVFACGPWLGELFPTLLGKKINVSKQEVFFFGPPGGSAAFEPSRFPIWIDVGRAGDLRGISYYGFPNVNGMGLKVAPDMSGPAFDPTHGERSVSPETLEATRRYVSRRLPALKDAPLVKTEVCQYERTPDANLILDRHPEMENVWIAGGGSGHGFKLGPKVGRLVAACVAGNNREKIPPELRLA